MNTDLTLNIWLEFRHMSRRLQTNLDTVIKTCKQKTIDRMSFDSDKTYG
jgi:hypothetical protein